MKKSKPVGLAPADWEQFFLHANVRVEELNSCKSSRAKAIKIGMFLSPLVGREVPIQVGERTGTATLRVVDGRAKEKRYVPVVRWDDPKAKAQKTTKKAVEREETPGKKKQAEKRAAGKKTNTTLKMGEKKKGAGKTATKPKKGGKKQAAVQKDEHSKPTSARGETSETAKKPTKTQATASRKGGGNDLEW